MRFPLTLLCVPLIVHLYVSAFYMGWHLSDPLWTLHAKNHLVRAMFGGAGLAVVGLALVFIPFRRGEIWAWWALVAVGFFAIGGFWLSYAIAEFAEPAEEEMAVLINGLSLLSYSLGLAFGWRAINKTHAIS